MSKNQAHNTWRRRILALASVPLLAVPSAMGVYGWLEPESGPLAAGSAAVGFEALYVGVNVLVLRSPELRRYARNVSMGAVLTAVIFNTLFHYGQKVAEAYTGAPFAMLPFVLALLASLPLAGLAYSVSVLMHRLSEDEAEHGEAHTPAAPTPTWAGPVLVAQPSASYARVAPQAAYPAPVRVERTPDVSGSDAVNRPAEAQNGAEEAFYRAGTRKTAPPAAPAYACKRCGAEGMSFAELGRHSRSCAGG